jgi:hypothetical protein
MQSALISVRSCAITAPLPFVSSTEGKESASQFEIAKKNVRLFSVAVFGDNVDLVL